MASIAIHLKYQKVAHTLTLAKDAKLESLLSQIHSSVAPDISIGQMKLLFKGQQISLNDNDDRSLQHVGLSDGTKVTLTGTTDAELETLKKTEQRFQEREIARQKASLRAFSTDKQPKKSKPSGNYILGVELVELKEISILEEGDLRVLRGDQLVPSPKDARNLLDRIRQDPAINKIINQRRWNIARLVEFEPQGKVGISESCLLGYNKNRGAEIGLRLRTDRLDGLRSYPVIIKTVLHELAHMEVDDHNNDFKELNSELNKDYNKFSRSYTLGAFGHKGKLDSVLDSNDESQQLFQGSISMLGHGDTNIVNREIERLSASSAASAAALKRFEWSQPHQVIATVERNEDVDDVEMTSDRIEVKNSSSCESDTQPNVSTTVNAKENVPMQTATDEITYESGTQPDHTLPTSITEVESMQTTTVDSEYVSNDDLVQPEKSLAMSTIDEPMKTDAGQEMADRLAIDSLCRRVAEVCRHASQSQIRSFVEGVGDAFVIEELLKPEMNRELRSAVAATPDTSHKISGVDRTSQRNDTDFEAKTRVEQAIQKIMTNDSYQLSGILQTMLNCIQKIINEPGNVRYRSMKLDNAAFNRKIGRFHGTLDLFTSIGFVTDYQKLKLNRVDLGLLWIAKSMLEESLSLPNVMIGLANG